MVTNQSGVARGFFDEAVVDQVHAHMAALLAAGGAHIDAYYYCPHHPDGKVARYRARLRLPQAGARAGRSRGARARHRSAASFTVGDRWLDVALARTVGARGILVRTGYGAEEKKAPAAGRARRPTRSSNNLVEAVELDL